MNGTWPSIYLKCTSSGFWTINDEIVFEPDGYEISIDGSKEFDKQMNDCWKFMDIYLQNSKVIKEVALEAPNGKQGNIPLFVDVETYIQLVGNSISMVSLFIAIVIFLSFK